MTREEHAAFAAYRALCDDVREAGGAVVIRTPAAPRSPMLNRVVGLGMGAAATEVDVDVALAAVGTGLMFYVAVAPGARPPELPQWLAARGLRPGWGWMAFRRGVGDPPRGRTSLRLLVVSTEAEAAAFARVVRLGYGLPRAIDAAVARAPERGWACWLALDGSEPAGAAALFAADGVAYLGFAATLPAYRGKGAQGALLAERIRHAGELGCDAVVTETGERRPGAPSRSYRNILRAGFQEVGVTANWLGRS